MRRKHAQDGLVCFSVSLDDPTDKPKVEAFLKEKGAAFPNFLLADERADAAHLEARFGYDGRRPHYVVFGRSGEKVWDLATKWLEHDEIEKLVERELAK
jgi:hypothetical protein